MRSLDSTLKSFIESNSEFVYAHLIKFEKPIKSISAEVDTNSLEYSYLTDASTNIVTNVEPFNGQTWYANKVKKVSAVSESIEAKASSLSLTISGIALGTEVTASRTSASVITSTYDLLEAGFSEGDTIEIVGGAAAGSKAVILSFSNENKSISVYSLYDVLDVGVGLTGIKYASEEVVSLTAPRTSSNYSNYINREVYIYKAFFDFDGNMQGDPLLIFKGIIASVKIDENPLSTSSVTWSLTSHWGDFVRVNGRLTSDSTHRALKENGVPDREALIRPAYADDFGFMHSETAINLIALYKDTEVQLQKKTKWGIAKYKEIEVEVDREVDLRINLQARYLPVIYGIQKVDSIPIFMDTKKSDAGEVYVVYALCEGQIAGLFDVYIDGSSTICIDKNDYDTRSSQTTENTVDVLCNGRMDRGDTLGGDISVYSNTNTLTQGVSTFFGVNLSNIGDLVESYIAANLTGTKRDVDFSLIGNWRNQTVTANHNYGILDKEAVKWDSPLPIELVFHSGGANQEADNVLTNIALANDFKIQSDYSTNPGNYWGPSHRLLDTAYVVAKYNITAEETTIPSLDFVVRGKLIECFNYDYEYTENYLGTNTTWANFRIGDSVTLYNTNTGGSLGTGRIYDLRTTIDEYGEIEYRVRFGSNVNSGGAPFHMVKGAYTWYLEPYNRVYKEYTVSTPLDELKADLAIVEPSLTAIPGTSPTAYYTKATVSGTSAAWNAVATSSLTGIIVGFISAVGETIVEANSLTTEFTSSTVATKLLINSNSISTTSEIGKYQVSDLVIKNVFVISSSVVPVTGLTAKLKDQYKLVVTTQTALSDGTLQNYVQERDVIDVVENSGYSIFKIDRPWDPGYIPNASYTWKIVSKGDKRVSLNPAMQLLDYMTDIRYGRGLSLDRDIDLDSFYSTARSCDTRSDVTVAVANTVDIQKGAIYKYPASGALQFRGTVSAVNTKGGKKEVVFTDVIGKLGKKWDDWYVFEAGDLVWTTKGAVGTAAAAGTIAEPTGTIGVSLTKVSGSGDATVALDLTESTFEGNKIVKSYTNDSSGYTSSGYSLYDSDFVKYWKFLGWDGREQRHVTRHQLNTVLETSTPVFDNINGLLNEFNGILRYSAGKYQLDIKAAADLVYTYGGTTHTPLEFQQEILTNPNLSYISSWDSTPILSITQDKIIGSISVEDGGQKNSYNTITVSIPDPQNKFDGRSVSYFNSEYLKQDRGIPKKTDLRTPDITNFYNARLNAKQYLEEARYNLKINFTVIPEAIQLTAGTVIKITYDRFNWVDKLFRITDLTMLENCLVQISAEEHNENAYIIRKQASSDTGKLKPGGTTKQLTPPTNLTTTKKLPGAIRLNWSNSIAYQPSSWKTEVWASDTDGFSAPPTGNPATFATLIGTVDTTTTEFTEPLSNLTKKNRYYWIRHVQKRKVSGVESLVYSAFIPDYSVVATYTGGKKGVALPSASSYEIELANPVQAVPVDLNSNVTDNTGTGTNLRVRDIQGNYIEYFATTAQAITAEAEVYWTLEGIADWITTTNGIVEGSVTSTPANGTTNPFVIGNHNFNTFISSTGQVIYTVKVYTGDTNYLIQKSQQFTKNTNSSAVYLIANTYVINFSSAISPVLTPSQYNLSWANPVLPIGITTPYFKLFETKYGGSPTVVTLGTNTQTSISNISATTSLAEYPVAYTIEMYSDSARTILLATDSITIGAASDGVQGAQGPQGIQGELGATGAQGAEGAQGPQGIQGELGATGAQGAEGAQGPQGLQGTLGATGAQGAVGAQGPQGLQGTLGATGAQGAVGAQGPQGLQGTLGATGATGAVGAQGPQGLQGTLGATGAQGAVGAQGPQGRQGTLGATGAQGAVGAQGPQGLQGTLGATGAQGAIGAQGPQGRQGTIGATGAQGAIGAQGPQGLQGTLGATGAQGAVGAQGPQGRQGTLGATGATGAEGAQGPQGLQGTLGATGAQGAVGAQGPQGRQGTIGATGAQGAIGAQGPQGLQGTLGATGAQGAVGAQGPQGRQGTIGATGAQGAVGAQGPQGLQGTLGATGAQGAVGAQGPQGRQGTIGATGAQGAVGAQGPQGLQGQLGVQGNPGATGYQGDIGFQGTTGLTGLPGDDVYIIYYNGLLPDNLNGNATVDDVNPPTAPNTNGGSTSINQSTTRITQADGTVTNWYTQPLFIGQYYYWATAVSDAFNTISTSEWSVSGYLQGPQGDLGPTGAQGTVGAQGPQGRQGTLGATGAQGAVGAQGPQGLQGTLGATGAQGAIGAQGPQGRQGTIGATGAQGAIGAQGPQGRQGTLGATGAQGAVGAQGPQGRQGTLGATGAQGAEGAQGPQGLQGTLGATGAQGAVGAQGPQGRQGTLGATGAQGAVGAQGPQGLQGTLGATGAQGAIGAQGPQGRQGTIGSQGFQGAIGAQGPQGLQGTLGATGAQGAIGAQGPQGRQGTIGATGAQGAEGAQGPQGLQGTLGATGAQGAIGAQGPQGRQGTIGATGAQGAIGAQGPQGLQGTLGATGAQGAIGAQGPQGRQGTIGSQGFQGAIGAQGPQGLQGTLGATGAQGAIGAQGPQGRQGTIGATGAQGAVGSQGPQGRQGNLGAQGPQGGQGAQGPLGVQGSVGITGAQGIAGAPAATIAFDTNNVNYTTTPATSTMESIISGVKGATPVSGDIYWQVKTDRVWQRGANSSTYTEYPRISAPGGSGNIILDGVQNQIRILDGGTVRVKIGNLSV